MAMELEIAAFPTFNNSAVLKSSSQSAGQFAGSLVVGLVTFGVQVLVFLLLKDRFARIYQPRTYLVPPRERTDPAPPGWFRWAKSVLSTSNSEFVQRCGLDAYFFLRYMRTLLKIFVPAALIMLPVLLPVNLVRGRGPEWSLTHPDQTNVTGLNQLSWSNIRPEKTNRYWAHWLMALLFIVYISYVAFDELRNYIRMRQAYITSPQHRLRASATTVLVSSIPPKWCSVERLDGLYDVFPGGLRNIWINRNFDELNEKVKLRDEIALQLEAAETDLIKKCYNKNEEKIKKDEKEAGKKLSKAEKRQADAIKDEKGQRQAEGRGITSGDPHQVKHTIQEQLGGTAEKSSLSDQDRSTSQQRRIPILGDGLQVVNHGFNKFNKGVRGALRGTTKGVNELLADTTGFAGQQDHLPSGGTNNETHRSNLHDSAVGAHITHENNGHADRTGHLAVPPSPLDVQNTEELRQTQISDNDRRPLNEASPISPTSTKTSRVEKSVEKPPKSGWQKFLGTIGLGSEDKEEVVYPEAYDKQYEEDGKDAVWRKYIEEKERDTHRLPITSWMFALPLIGKKVDTIYWCRKELARLNIEIEDDQAHPDRFPLMNSAFVQFNNQVAAHMACQSVSHHLPQQMAPRLVEIDPSDVIWDNMSIPWWQNYIRTAVVISIVTGMVILWAIPVAFTASLAQLTLLAEQYSWLSWVLMIPTWIRSALQGVLPIALLGLLTFLLPVILRFLCRMQGIQSGMLIELSVQKYYFFFIFVQLFLIVTVGSSLPTLVADLTSVQGISSVPRLLGTTIPVASNYFFSYMLLQALSVSSGALLQIGSLIVWFLLAPILDNTARAKFNRQTNLQNIQWGTFFPVYTNLACIGIIYSVISPLILVFNIITFALFWFVYRYNTLYVTRFTLDTGGLLYPNAINCTFVGVYVLEIGLIGLFFLVRDQDDNVACEGQAIGMIIILILTAIYQILLNNAFSPLFRYLPITLEDDAVRRDEEFARALRVRHGRKSQHAKLIENERDDEDIEDQLENEERKSLEDDRKRQEYEMKRIASDRHRRASHDSTQEEEPELEPYTFQNPEINLDMADNKVLDTAKRLVGKTVNTLPVPVITREPSKRHERSWADRHNKQNRRSEYFGQAYHAEDDRRSRSLSQMHNRTNNSQTQRILNSDGALAPPSDSPHTSRASSDNRDRKHRPAHVLSVVNNFNPIAGDEKDLEAQRKARAELSDALYAGVNDELEDLTPEQRDALVQRAFQHSALRARRPVVWIPRDELGVSDNEVENVGRFAEGNIWISNVRQGLDSKGRCVYSGAPPDFSEVDLIQL